MAKIKGVALGERVYWVDPDGISNDWYNVVTINGEDNADKVEHSKQDENFSWEDAIIGIDNGYSYAEVWLRELRFGNTKSKRKDK